MPETTVELSRMTRGLCGTSFLFHFADNLQHGGRLRFAGPVSRIQLRELPPQLGCFLLLAVANKFTHDITGAGKPARLSTRIEPGLLLFRNRYVHRDCHAARIACWLILSISARRSYPATNQWAQGRRDGVFKR